MRDLEQDICQKKPPKLSQQVASREGNDRDWRMVVILVSWVAITEYYRPGTNNRHLLLAFLEAESPRSKCR